MDVNSIGLDLGDGLFRQNLCGNGKGTRTKFNCSRLSSHISCSVKVQHNIMQANFPSPGPV